VKYLRDLDVFLEGHASRFVCIAGFEKCPMPIEFPVILEKPKITTNGYESTWFSPSLAVDEICCLFISGWAYCFVSCPF